MKTLRIRDVWHFLWLTIFAVGALAGCAVIEDINEPVKTAQPQPVQRKPAQRELGSLWSEDSQWNHVYTNATARLVGDIIAIRLDDAFKARLAKLRDGSDAQEEKKDEASKPGSPSEGADKVSVTDLVIRGSIEEVGQRGIYRITAGDTLRVGSWEPYVVIKGRVRDRDISGNDEVRIADVVDLSFDVLKTEPVPGQRKDVENVSW